MVVQYYQFNPVGYVVWWGLMGALFGAAGDGLWWLLAHRRPSLPGAAHRRGA